MSYNDKALGMTMGMDSQGKLEEKVTDSELNGQTMRSLHGAYKLCRKHKKIREIIQDYTQLSAKL